MKDKKTLVQTMINNFIYNQNFNKMAHYPGLNSLIGIARIGVHSYSLTGHVLAILEHLRLKGILNQSMLGFRDIRYLHALKAYVDLREIVRGTIEAPPIIGALGSWLWDSYCLSPAQQLAYRIQEIYETRLNANDEPLNTEDFIDVNLATEDYCEDFIDFINGQSVKISNNEEKIAAFLQNFMNGAVENEIFNDKKLPYYALAAFACGKIDREDMASIMEFYMAKQCFADCKLCRTFDNKGNLTQDAEDLYGYLTTGNGLATPKTDLPEKFVVKLRELPVQKQLFWHYEALFSQKKFHELFAHSPYQAAELHYSPVGSLYVALAYIGALKTCNNREIGLSFGYERILLNLKYQKTNNPLHPKLGSFSVREIKANVMDYSRRLCATFFPTSDKPITTIHNSLELPTVIITHDKSHAEILQSYPMDAQTDLKRLVRIFQEATGFDMSKEIWEMIEMVTPGLFYPHLWKEQGMFLYYFMNDASSKFDEVCINELFFQNEQPTPLYWIMALDIEKNRCDYQSKRSLSHILANYCNTRKDFINPDDTIKQKIWKFQLAHFNQPIVEVADDQLEFRKISEGIRKNTIILVKKN